MVRKVQAIDNFRTFAVAITKGKTYEVLSQNIFGDYLIIDDNHKEQYCFPYRFVEIVWFKIINPFQFYY